MEDRNGSLPVYWGLNEKWHEQRENIILGGSNWRVNLDKVIIEDKLKVHKYKYDKE